MKNNTTPAVLCVSGLKNSGKTHLIEALIPMLSEHGISTAVIKHHGHGFGDKIPDKPGTDTYRFLANGAHGIVIYDDETLVLIKRQTAEIKDLIALFPGADLIIIEGGKTEPYPRIVMLRPDQKLSDVTDDPDTVLCTLTYPDYDLIAVCNTILSSLNKNYSLA